MKEKSLLIYLPVFALISFLFHYGRTKGFFSPFIFLGSDAANVSSFIAARIYPELFKNDFLLSDFNNFGFYWSLHFPIIQVLARIMGDVGNAYMSSLGLHAFVQLLGYFMLGRKLFNNHFLAFCFALCTVGIVFVGMGEYFGFYRDPQLRFTYQALLPYGLILAFGANNLMKSCLTMLYFGTIFLFHPVSGLPIGFAVWVALYFKNLEYGKLTALLKMFFPAVIFNVLVGTFLLRYFLMRENNVGAEITPEIALLIREHFSKFHSLSLSAKDIANNVFIMPLITIFLLSTALLLFRSKSEVINQHISFIKVFSVGLGFIGLVVPAIDLSIASYFDRLPVQIDLIRMIRYLPLILLIFFFLRVSVLKSFYIKYSVGLAGATFWLWHFLPVEFSEAYHCLRRGGEKCQQDLQQTVDMLTFLKNNANKNTPIFAIEYQGLVIRYHALLPVSYCKKDRNMLAYVNPLKFAAWLKTDQNVEAVLELANKQERTKGILALAKKIESSFAVLPKGLFKATNVRDQKLVFENRSFLIYSL